ncbi:MAG: hypothetical protein FWF25_03795 [Propionibacteriaceae bacterium]|nr:hypothetical protein [Propionibacteriaceae bacterium]
MTVYNLVGTASGSRMALKLGNHFIRTVFLIAVVVCHRGGYGFLPRPRCSCRRRSNVEPVVTVEIADVRALG